MQVIFAFFASHIFLAFFASHLFFPFFASDLWCTMWYPFPYQSLASHHALCVIDEQPIGSTYEQPFPDWRSKARLGARQQQQQHGQQRQRGHQHLCPGQGVLQPDKQLRPQLHEYGHARIFPLGLRSPAAIWCRLRDHGLEHGCRQYYAQRQESNGTLQLWLWLWGGWSLLHGKCIDLLPRVSCFRNMRYLPSHRHITPSSSHRQCHHHLLLWIASARALLSSRTTHHHRVQDLDRLPCPMAPSSCACARAFGKWTW